MQTEIRNPGLVGQMFNMNHSIINAVMRVDTRPVVRTSTVGLQVRRHADAPRSVKGPVVEVLLKTWPKERIVNEIIALSVRGQRAETDKDVEAEAQTLLEIAKIRSLCNEHEKLQPGFTASVWETIDKRLNVVKEPVIKHDMLNVPHGSNTPGTMGEELNDELAAVREELAARQTQHPENQIPAANATVKLGDTEAGQLLANAFKGLGDQPQPTI